MKQQTAILAEKFRQLMETLPYVSAEFKGLGGRIKAQNDHFQVEEILPYSPCGKGEHLYVTVKRSGWNTLEVARSLAGAAGIPTSQVGFGGRKDKNALVVQTFSLCLDQTSATLSLEKQLSRLPFEIIAINRHTNKIKIGHVAANRFKILLSQVEPQSIGPALRIAATLTGKGIANYYGPQRFGRGGANIQRALHLALVDSRIRRPDRFMVSVFQALLFNTYLNTRFQQGLAFTMLEGDIAKKTDTGGIFLVDDQNEANQRFNDHRIVYTGPIYGHKMLAARKTAGALEQQVLASTGLAPERLKHIRARGSRRPAILFLEKIKIEPAPNGLWFEFTLPSGAYATVIMREFIKD